MSALQQVLAAGVGTPAAQDPDWASVRFRSTADVRPFVDATGKTITNTGIYLGSERFAQFGTANIPGQFGDCAYFPGSSNQLEHGVASDATFLHNGSSWSMEWWHRAWNGFGSLCTLWKSCGGGTLHHGVWIELTTSRQIRFLMVNGVASTPTVDSTFSTAFPNDTSAHHFVRLTYDPALGSNHMALSFDGGAESYISRTGASHSATVAGQRLTQGEGVTAAMDDWRITEGVIRPNTLPTAAFPTS